MGKGGEKVASSVATTKSSSVVALLAGVAVLGGSLVSERFFVDTTAEQLEGGWYIIAFEIGRCCLTHLGAYLLLGGVPWPLLREDPKARSILARSVMNVAFLGFCGYEGVRMWTNMYDEPTDFRTFASALGASTKTLSFVPATPRERLYASYPDFQRLAAVMAAFQLKNIADTLYYKDGVVFLVHHVITVVVALCALYPFAHFHGTFFFGVSETSTTLLALLANFDKDHGVPALETGYPATRKIVGGLFALSFLVVRGVMWPFFSYFFIDDCLAVLANGHAHDTLVVKGFIAMLATLSVMQLLWLGQIGHAIYTELVKPILLANPEGKKKTS